jgi:hypothetical protein
VVVHITAGLLMRPLQVRRLMGEEPTWISSSALGTLSTTVVFLSA